MNVCFVRQQTILLLSITLWVKTCIRSLFQGDNITVCFKILITINSFKQFASCFIALTKS